MCQYVCISVCISVSVCVFVEFASLYVCASVCVYQCVCVCIRGICISRVHVFAKNTQPVCYMHGTADAQQRAADYKADANPIQMRAQRRGAHEKAARWLRGGICIPSFKLSRKRFPGQE